MSDSAVYPWQREQWDSCIARLNRGRLPHALLVHGEAGLGIVRFAEELTRALLCGSEKKPCGSCRGCLLHASGNHPDFREIKAQKEGGEIRIRQIRELLPFVQTARHYDTFKTVLLRDADMMNRAAANGLLKMLEEPPPGTVLVLTSHHAFRLPATVRSRCQAVRLYCPDPDQARAWLVATASLSEAEAERRLAGCNWRPLHALDVGPDGALTREDFRNDIAGLIRGQGSVVDISEKWQEISAAVTHRWLLEIAEETIRRGIKKGQGRLFLRKLFNFHDRQKRRCLLLKVPLNPRVQLESALVEWQSARSAR